MRTICTLDMSILLIILKKLHLRRMEMPERLWTWSIKGLSLILDNNRLLMTLTIGEAQVLESLTISFRILKRTKKWLFFIWWGSFCTAREKTCFLTRIRKSITLQTQFLDTTQRMNSRTKTLLFTSDQCNYSKDHIWLCQHSTSTLILMQTFTIQLS